MYWLEVSMKTYEKTRGLEPHVISNLTRNVCVAYANYFRVNFPSTLIRLFSVAVGFPHS